MATIPPCLEAFVTHMASHGYTSEIKEAGGPYLHFSSPALFRLWHLPARDGTAQGLRIPEDAVLRSDQDIKFVSPEWLTSIGDDLVKIVKAIPSKAEIHQMRTTQGERKIEYVSWWVSPTVQVEWDIKAKSVSVHTKEQDEQMEIIVSTDELGEIVPFIERHGKYAGWVQAGAAWLKECTSSQEMPDNMSGVTLQRFLVGGREVTRLLSPTRHGLFTAELSDGGLWAVTTPYHQTPVEVARSKDNPWLDWAEGAGRELLMHMPLCDKLHKAHLDRLKQPDSRPNQMEADLDLV